MPQDTRATVTTLDCFAQGSPLRGAFVRRHSDAQEVYEQAAERFVQLAAAAIDRESRFTVALAGGSTPRAFYERLTTFPYRKRIDWSKVVFFWGDERCVPPSDVHSNYRMARAALLEPLGISDRQVHRMPAEQDDLDAAARRYQDDIAQVFNISAHDEPPCIDLVLLGLGADGHTASLFPHTQAPQETHRWAVPNAVPALQTCRLTMTPHIINRAAHVLFVVVGAEKASALAKVLEGPYAPERLPAQLISPAAGRLEWLVDEPAARGLIHHTGIVNLTAG
ncbi:MAG: 6-phosphogluconolactonase [Gammaproteobacteria bacterium]